MCGSAARRDPAAATSARATQEAQAYAEENGLFFMETSAKTASNVNGARAGRWGSHPPPKGAYGSLRRGAAARRLARRPATAHLAPHALLARHGARLSVATRLGGPAEMFYEIARKLPKSSPVAAPTNGIVLTDRVRARAPGL